MLLKSPLPNQTKDIYTLLLKKGKLSAEQIGKELKIFPHAVYRSTDQLVALGCVNEKGRHPAFFEALPVHESVETFALLQREWFLKAFMASQSADKSLEGQLNLSFIESREMMLEKELHDFTKVKEEVNVLVSGDELPAEIMLAIKKTIDNGISVREIVQKNDEENRQLLQARKQMGMQLRYHPPVNARILLFDRRVVYFMSYDPTNYLDSNGVRFEYAPLGQLMYSLFMTYWEKGIAL